MSALDPDLQRAIDFVANSDIEPMLHQRDYDQLLVALADEFTSIRNGERAAIVAWLRSKAAEVSREPENTVSGWRAASIERGEHVP